MCEKTKKGERKRDGTILFARVMGCYVTYNHTELTSEYLFTNT